MARGAHPDRRRMLATGRHQLDSGPARWRQLTVLEPAVRHAETFERRATAGTRLDMVRREQRYASRCSIIHLPSRFWYTMSKRGSSCTPASPRQHRSHPLRKCRQRDGYGEQRVEVLLAVSTARKTRLTSVVTRSGGKMRTRLSLFRATQLLVFRSLFSGFWPVMQVESETRVPTDVIDRSDGASGWSTVRLGRAP